MRNVKRKKSGIIVMYNKSIIGKLSHKIGMKKFNFEISSVYCISSLACSYKIIKE